jgi:serine protease Do
MSFAGFGPRTWGAAAPRALVAFGVAGALLAALPAAGDAPAGSVADRLPSLAPIVDKVLPAVVNISVVQKLTNGPDDSDDSQQGDNDDQDQGQGQRPGPQTPFDEFLRRFFEQQQQQNRHGGPMPFPGQKVMSLGSGFIIDPQGYVVTNNHVVGDADKVTVIFQDNSKHPAKIVGKDIKTDLALLKIDAEKPLPFVKFGDSDKARVGDWVIAVGNPFGLGGTVTKGIISARGRPVEDQSYVDFLQVDASINKGNSGGPTFDLAGDVIGINTAIFSPNGGSVGIGFAIPSNSAKGVLEQLKTAGHVERGWLGVQIQEVTPEIASSIGMDQNHPIGALVAAVTDNSPASKAGIKVGDVVEKFDGKPVDKMRDLPRLVAETSIGKTVTISLLRGGQVVDVQATVAQLDETKVAAATPGDDAKGGKASSLGLSLSTLSPDARKRLNLPKEVQGVLVNRVKDGSPAQEHGIEAGDVIVQVNGKDVGKPDDVVELVKAVKPGDKKSILLLVNRRGQNRFVAIEPEDKNG